MNKRIILIVAAVSACLLLLVIWLLFERNDDSYQQAMAAAEQRMSADLASVSAMSDEAKADWKPDPKAAPAGFTKEAETKQLVLYMNRETTEIAIKNKDSGKIWRSNPEGRENDPIASGANKKQLSALFSVTTTTKNGQPVEMNSFSDSVEAGQVKLESIQDGVKATYTIGVMGRGLDSIPMVISKSRMEEKILNKLTDTKKQSEIKKRFKYDEATETYTRREISSVAINSVLAILDEAGYTEEDLAYDLAENGAEGGSSKEFAQYELPVEFKLAGDRLNVRINSADIKQLGSLPIQTITVMEMFGAADSKQSGYMFVPDGSGALIHNNNGKTASPAYIAPVYGVDQAIMPTEQLNVLEPIRMPVYGMKQGDDAWLAIIEKGDAIATIKADVSGRLHDYNIVAPRFTLKSQDNLVITGAGKSTSNVVSQTHPYQGDLIVSYGFLHGEKANYAGMAEMYRNYLVDRHGLTPLEPQPNTPFTLELVGGTETFRSFLGVPYDAVEGLTTYDQALDIITQLQDKQIDAIKLRYSGWFNGGLFHSAPGKVDFDGAVGSAKEFNRFVQEASKRNVSVYPDAAFNRIYKEGAGFSSSKDTIKYMSQLPASVYDVDMPTFLHIKDLFSYYPLAEHRLPDLMESFTKQMSKTAVTGLSFRDLGEDLNSNFDNSRPATRQHNAAIVEMELEKAKQSFPDLMVSGGNAYTLPYVKAVVNAPNGNNGINITDEAVPFYQLVLHGYVDISAAPFNEALDQSSRMNVLKAIETGSNVYYRWIYEKGTDLTKTTANMLYANHYQNWIDEAVQTYQEVNEALKGVRHMTITGHSELSDRVYCTTYEDGTKIYVNYNEWPVSVDGISIDGLGYKVGGN
ncbi:DUF5696 domain-containing protein [Paenibacillus marinisediminis]